MMKRFIKDGVVYTRPDKPKSLPWHMSDEEAAARGYEPYTPPPQPDPTSEELEQRRILLAKGIAHQKIIAIADETKQRNMIARSVELDRLLRDNGSLTAQEQAEYDAMDSIWQRIKAIRSASNQIEATPGEDPETSTLWPE